MRKYRLCVIRKQGDQYRPLSIRFHRDVVTGDCSVSLSGHGHMLMICMEKVIPGLASIVYPYHKFPRRFPYGILAESENIFRK